MSSALRVRPRLASNDSLSSPPATISQQQQPLTAASSRITIKRTINVGSNSSDNTEKLIKSASVSSDNLHTATNTTPLLSTRRIDTLINSIKSKPTPVQPITNKSAKSPGVPGRRRSIFKEQQLDDDNETQAAIYELQKTVTGDTNLSILTKFDIYQLCQLFTVINIEQYEPVMKQGETASFLGLLLKGELTATVDTASHLMQTGTFIGELAYFATNSAQRQRTANVVCSSGTGAVIAVLTYSELDGLIDGNAELYGKLMKLLAVVSIDKLNKQYMTARSVIANAGTATATPQPNSSPIQPPTHRSSTSITSMPTSSGMPLQQPGNSSPKNQARPRLQPVRSNSVIAVSQSSHSRTSSRDMTQLPVLSHPATAAGETLLRTHLDTTLHIRTNVIWTNDTSEFAGANHILALHPTVVTLTQPLEVSAKLKIWCAYHASSVNRSLSNVELRHMARDYVEVILRNYANWLKAQNSKKTVKLRSVESLQAILSNEKEFLLPGSGKQTDTQAINSMTKYIASCACVGKSRMVSEDMFCINFEKIIGDTLEIDKKGDQPMSCTVM